MSHRQPQPSAGALRVVAAGAIAALAVSAAVAAGVGAADSTALGTPSTAGPRAATAASKHTVGVKLPVRATAKKRTIRITFSPKKPTKVKLQRWKSGHYVTVKTVRKPRGHATSFHYTPPTGRTKLRAVALWPHKHRATTRGKVTTWVKPGTTPTTPKPKPKPSTTPTPTPTPTPTHTSGVLDGNGDPTVNIDEPSALSACWSYGSADSRCQNAAVAAINLGRTREGLAHFALPANWNALTPAQQLLAISNDERAVRGLRAISGLNATLNGYAMTGAQNNADPLLPGWIVDGKSAYGWASNWAITPGGPLYSNFLWMYDDGIGAGNIDCTVGHTGGCWGHRHNILMWGAADPSTVLMLGAAETTTTWSGWSGLSDATLLVKLAP